MRNILRKLIVHLQSLLKQEHGQDLVEYALVIGMVAIYLLSSIRLLANAIANVFHSLSNLL